MLQLHLCGKQRLVFFLSQLTTGFPGNLDHVYQFKKSMPRRQTKVSCTTKFELETNSTFASWAFGIFVGFNEKIT